MNRSRIVRGLISTLAIAATIASCGGSDSDSDSENGAASDSTADVAPTATNADDAASDDAVTEDEATDNEPTDDEATGDESDDDSDSGSTTNCDAIFSMAEVEEFFVEPVTLTEETDDSLGQLVCFWETIEDPDDIEDSAFKTLNVQLYSGSPVDAQQFINPSVWESVTMIEGVGDLAYSVDMFDADFYFYDDPIGGSLSYAELDLGNVDAPKLHDRDDVEQLLRTFHERVT